MRKVQLLVYPILELVLFLLAIKMIPVSMILSVICLLLSACMLGFTLHISVHYTVHHKSAYRVLNRLIELMNSACIGIPYNHYQIQHFLHHRFDNELEDPTTTWQLMDDALVPKSLWKYSFLWFANSSYREKFDLGAKKYGYLKSDIKKKMLGDLLINIIVLIACFYTSITVGLYYLLLIYLGWAVVSIINYGQHLPEHIDGKRIKGYSYYKAWYNCLLVHNGKHYEHHQQAGIPYWDIENAVESAAKNKWPQCFDAFRFLWSKSSR